MPALLMVPYAATFVTPVSTGEDAVIYGVVLAIGALDGVVIARRFGVPDVVDGEHYAPPVAATVTIVFGIVMAASAAVGVALDWTEPYWVPEPVLILVLYILMGKRDRIRGKAIGTGLGIAAAIPVAMLSPPAGVLTAVGVVAFLSRSRRPRPTGSCTASTPSRSCSCSPHPGRSASRPRSAASSLRGHRPARRVGDAIVHAPGRGWRGAIRNPERARVMSRRWIAPGRGAVRLRRMNSSVRLTTASHAVRGSRAVRRTRPSGPGARRARIRAARATSGAPRSASRWSRSPT